MEAQQQQQYHYHYQTQNDATSASVSLSYDPGQVQGYDQSTQGYYPYHQQQQHYDYSSYYYPDYSNSYQTHQPHNDPNSIHPPGVPIPIDSQQTYLQNPQNVYYQHGAVTAQPPPSQGHMTNSIMTS